MKTTTVVPQQHDNAMNHIYCSWGANYPRPNLHSQNSLCTVLSKDDVVALAQALKSMSASGEISTVERSTNFDVLLRKKGEELVLTKASAKCFLRRSVKFTAFDNGFAFVVSAKPLAAVLETVDCETVDLEFRDSHLEIWGDAFRARFACRTGNSPEFPGLEAVRPTLHVSASVLKSLLFQTTYAMCLDGAEDPKSGVTVSMSGTTLSLTASDETRRAQASASLEMESPHLSFRLSPDAAELLETLTANEEEEDVGIHVCDDLAYFFFEKCEVACRIEELPFCEGDNNSELHGAAQVQRAALIAAINRASMLSDDSWATLSVASESVYVLSVGGRGGAHIGTELFSEREGFPLLVDFPVNCLLEALLHIPSDDVLIQSSYPEGIEVLSSDENARHWVWTSWKRI